MFNFFNRNKNFCPIDTDTRLWMENAFLWLAGKIGKKEVIDRRVRIPTLEDFEISPNSLKEVLKFIVERVAEQMQIDKEEINVVPYSVGIKEIETGLGYTIIPETDVLSTGNTSAATYFGKNNDGKYDIFIEEKYLTDFEILIAVLSHEFAHIKILGENLLDYNDEYLTDLASVLYGFGIFSANSAFKSYKDNSRWGYTSVGYFSQKEWAYALAIFCYYRSEKTPFWINYLSPNIKSDF